MITAELTEKIDLLPQESYEKVERLVEQLFVSNVQKQKEKAFQTLMQKLEEAEKSVEEHGGYSAEEVEAELAKI